VKRSRYVFHVQDLQPDAALGLGMLKPGPFTRALYQLEAMAYRRAAAVSGISDGMLAAFERKGVPPERRWYFPNWINRLTSAAQPDEAERFRAQHGIEPGAMLAIYSGNIGRKQGLAVLIEAAVLIEKESPSAGRGTPVRILIVGDGAARVELEGVIAKSGLKHLRLLPLLSDADYRAALAAMEVAVITQTAGTGQYFFPSKLLSVLAAGKPVITVADSSSELAQAVAAGGFGRNVLPGDPAQLATVIAELAANPAQLTRLAEGTTWVRRFEREQVLGAYLERLRQIACTR
jgi:colanic acid biosynthesis glycosyl transferase WcaI